MSRKLNLFRISQQRRHEPQAPVREEERQQLRGLIGSLQYASTNTRPDLGSRLSFLQSHINSACVETLMDGNRALQEAKKHADTCLRIQPIPLRDIRFLFFLRCRICFSQEHLIPPRYVAYDCTQVYSRKSK